MAAIRRPAILMTSSHRTLEAANMDPMTLLLLAIAILMTLDVAAAQLR